MKKLFLLSGMALFSLSGCLGELIEWSCVFTEDEDHCYQAAAVQQSDTENCENIEGADFSSSNPPKDKCYLMIAENTGDPSVCDDIVGGAMSYTREECIANVLRTGSPEDCVNAADETACRTAYQLNGGDCGYGFVYKDEQCQDKATIAEETEEESEGGLSNAEQADIQTIVDAATGKYMELLEKDIELETDPARLAGLQAYRDFLQQAGETMESAQTTFDDLSAVKRIFLDTYDDSMHIRNFNVSNELDPGLFDKIKDRLFGPGEPLTGINRENADAENGIKIYEAMLEQQSENEFLQKDSLSRLGDVVASKFRDEVTGKVVDGAKELAEGIAGTAFGAVTHIGEALQAFQDEAKKQTFIGLARAYNRRREVLQNAHPELTSQELHERTVREVKEDPYQDLQGLSPIRFENLLDNDCANYSGELCISPDVWWTAMGKTFEYNKKNK